jgi:hypothetical protein
MVVRIPEHLILEEGLHYAGFTVRGNLNNLTKKNLRRFREWYGAGPDSCSEIYYDLQTQEDAGMTKHNIKYFFMALNWLTMYPTESVRAGCWGVDENTAREWTRSYVLAIQALKLEKVRRGAARVGFTLCGPGDSSLLPVSLLRLYARLSGLGMLLLVISKKQS